MLFAVVTGLSAEHSMFDVDLKEWGSIHEGEVSQNQSEQKKKRKKRSETFGAAYFRALEPLMGVYKPPDRDTKHRRSVYQTCPVHARCTIYNLV